MESSGMSEDQAREAAAKQMMFDNSYSADDLTKEAAYSALKHEGFSNETAERATVSTDVANTVLKTTSAGYNSPTDVQAQQQATYNTAQSIADASREKNNSAGTLRMNGGQGADALASNIIGTAQNWDTLKENGQLGQAFGGMAAQAGVMAVNAIDKLAMGDKNFGAQSAAIDSAVHGVSGALMKSGNPYAMAAGAALEGANFLTKAGGQTVQGFDVNIDNSGYGNIGHMESSSSRDFGAMIGLGGLNQAKMQRKLQDRNHQAQMALKAANVSDTTKFEQEARMNSVDDVLRANSIALAGGIDTNVLGS